MKAELYNPLVSVVIPVYNGSNYLKQAIESALNQTYKNIEILVINDGSQDDGKTEKIALGYGERIRYFSKKNGGSSSALNVGIKNMKGEWFSWLSHDDLYYTNKIQIQIDYIRQLNINSDDVYRHLFFADSDFIDKDGKFIRVISDKKKKKMQERVDKIKDNAYLVAEPTIYNFYGCTCLIHKSILEKVGGFDETFRLANDLELWNRLYCEDTCLHYIPQTIVSNRIHSAQISRSIGFSYHNSEQDKIWNDKLNWLIKRCPQNYRIFYLFGKNALLKTRYKEGKIAFKKAGNIKPAKKPMLFIQQILFMAYSYMKTCAKNIYMKIKI